MESGNGKFKTVRQGQSCQSVQGHTGRTPVPGGATKPQGVPDIQPPQNKTGHSTPLPFAGERV